MQIRCVAISLILWTSLCSAQDINGDLNTNIQDSTVDSNNASTTNNYNATGLVVLPRGYSNGPNWVMGGGGNDGCLIPSSRGIQISLLGIAEGQMEQDRECNRRRGCKATRSAASGWRARVTGFRHFDHVWEPTSVQSDGTGQYTLPDHGRGYWAFADRQGSVREVS